MKKVFLTLFAVGSIVAAQAQTAGSILVYGDAGFSYGKSDLGSTTFGKTMKWNFNPGVGYQFNDHMTVGLALGWDSKLTTPYTPDTWMKMHTYEIGAFYRYTMMVPKTPLFLYSQVNAGYTGGFSEYGNSPSFNKESGFYAGLMPALGLNIGKCFQINFSIGGLDFRRVQTTDGAILDPNTGVVVPYTGTMTSTNFDFTFGKTVNFGISKNFGGHKMKGHHMPMDDTRKLDISDDEEDVEIIIEKKDVDEDE